MEKLKNIKALFIDLDGTLCNSRYEITYKTKEAIKQIKNKGIYIILCSGRNNEDLCKFSKEACASNFVISSNGSQIFNYTKHENFYENIISQKVLNKIWKYGNENKLEIILNSDNCQYGNNFFCSDIYKNKIIVDNISKIGTARIYQIIINSNDFYDMNKFEEFLKQVKEVKIANFSREYLKNITNYIEPYYMFINNKNIDKGKAISVFLEKMKIKKEETICFGDRINDIKMFNSCGFKVAMKNADDELKKIADYITLSNNEDGVADFIYKFLL